jgi:dephospho-CoA kinase
MIGWVMGFIVAIIGRFGVGKSLLCDHFVKNGMTRIDIDQDILSEIKDSPNYSLCYACLNKDYEDITEIVPILSDSNVMDVLVRKIEKERSEGHCNVIVLPSFLELTGIVELFDFVVAVDCSRLRQRKYLAGNALSEAVVSHLLDSGYDRHYYTTRATDVFLNSVSLEHVAWVASQIFKSYRLANIYK